MQKFVLCYLVFTCSVFCNSNGLDRDEWVQPDAWSRNHQKYIASSSSENQGKHEQIPNTERDTGYLLYKRLIQSLFLKDQTESSETRILKFTMTEKQQQILKSSSNIHDWDGVISEIILSLESVGPESNYIYESKKHSYFTFSSLLNLNTFSSIAAFLSQSEIQFTLVVILLISVGVYLKRKYRWGVISIIVLTFLTSGYFFTYYECNRQLEIDEFINNNPYKQNNPCEENKEPKSFFASITNFFSNPQKDCEEYLRKKHKIKLRYCRPDEVWTKYMNQMFYNQIETLIHESIKIIRRCANDIPFPYNWLAMIILPSVMVFVIKLMFQHVLNPATWFQYYKHHNPEIQQPTSRAEPIENGISGEHFTAVLDTIRAVSNLAANATNTALLSNKEINIVSSGLELMSRVEVLDDNDLNHNDSGTVSNESGIDNDICDQTKTPVS